MRCVLAPILPQVFPLNSPPAKQPVSLPNPHRPRSMYDSGPAGFPTSMSPSSDRPGKTAASGFSNTAISESSIWAVSAVEGVGARRESLLSLPAFTLKIFHDSHLAQVDIALVPRLALTAPFDTVRPGEESEPPADSDLRVLLAASAARRPRLRLEITLSIAWRFLI